MNTIELPPGLPATPVSDLLLEFLKILQLNERRAIGSFLLLHRLELAELVHYLVRERLAVQAFAVLDNLKLKPLFPEKTWELLKDQWQQQQIRNKELLDELVRIDRALVEAGIEYRLLKGLYLGERFYGGINFRFTWDIDVLVRPSDIWKALEILDKSGFAKPSFSYGLERLAPKVAHALECRRADGLSVDLHWAFRRLPGLHIHFDELWQRKKHYLIGGHEFPVPSDEFTLLQLLLGIAADIDRGMCRMRSVWDVYRVIQAMPDSNWRGFLAEREADGSLRLVVNALALVLTRLDCHDEFPALTLALDAYGNMKVVQNGEQARTILARVPHGLDNHWLFSQWQPLPQWQYWSWWAATLPLRFFFARRL